MIKDRGTHFKVRVTHKGQQRWLPEKFKTKAEAELAEALAMGRPAPESRITVAEWREDWLDNYQGKRAPSTTHGYRKLSKAFSATFGAYELDALPHQAVRLWAQESGEKKVDAARVLLNSAIREGRMTQSNPLIGLGISRSEGRKHWDPARQLPPAEVDRTIDQAYAMRGPVFGAFLTTLAFTAARPGELFALKWENVYLKEDLFHIGEALASDVGIEGAPKTDAGWRDVPILPRVRKALLRMPRSHQRYVFTATNGGRMNEENTRYQFKLVREALGREDLDLYHFRHFAIWWMLNELEMDRADIALIVGHRDGGVLIERRYGHRSAKKAHERFLKAAEGWAA